MLRCRRQKCVTKDSLRYGQIKKKILKIGCEYIVKLCFFHSAPDNCLQWFTGKTGTIESFNFKSGKYSNIFLTIANRLT